MDINKKHPLGEKVTAYNAFAVYYDADGNAPDSDDLAIFSTEELAQEAAEIFAEQKDNEEPVGIKIGDEVFCGFPSPFVPGYEFACGFRTRGTLSTSPLRSIAEFVNGYADEVYKAEEFEGKILNEEE
jgi:hypothetical protein